LNDRLGHAGGDEVLLRVAGVMNAVIRETDLLARYGGEEFALVAPNTDLDGARQLAEKIRQAVGATDFVPHDDDLRVTVSLGVALYAGDRRRLFEDADDALYRAKDAGRDCVVVAGSETRSV
jgi:diguanylate cyclase (GGDEF)-like protein